VCYGNLKVAVSDSPSLIRGVSNRSRNSSKNHLAPSGNGGGSGVVPLPSLATAEQIAAPLQVTARTVHLWAAANPPVIPVAFRQGRIVRFHPPDVARALGITLPEFGVSTDSGEIRTDEV
jgi:hypothetical protein